MQKNEEFVINEETEKKEIYKEANIEALQNTKKGNWFNKLINRIKKIFHKNNSNSLTNEEIEQIEKQKSDGEPYAKMFDDKYKRMSAEEKEQTDNFMKELEEKIGFDNDDEI